MKELATYIFRRKTNARTRYAPVRPGRWRAGCLGLILLAGTVCATGDASAAEAGKFIVGEPRLKEDICFLQKMSCNPLDSLPERLEAIDSTHIIRRYHGRYALFNVEGLITAAESQADAATDKESFLHGPVHVDFSGLQWRRRDAARPIDALRLTFRGNGIPGDIEKLAESKLIEPPLRAFYQSLTPPNTTLWTGPETVRFEALTMRDKAYQAKSTPFISVQRLSKQEFAKMKSAALPFLWKAYVEPELAEKERKEKTPEELGELQPAARGNAVRQMPDVIPRTISDAIMRQQKEAVQETQAAVTGFRSDSVILQELFYKQLIGQSADPGDRRDIMNAIIDQRRQRDYIFDQKGDRHAQRLAGVDPEFIALFLINNLFEQYNIFSTFKEGVSLKINAIDTRLNVLYISYNTTFSAVEGETPIEGGCRGGPVRISDEFFLVTGNPDSYLIRVYLPDCVLAEADYDKVDAFLNHLRLVNKGTL